MSVLRGFVPGFLDAYRKSRVDDPGWMWREEFPNLPTWHGTPVYTGDGRAEIEVTAYRDMERRFNLYRVKDGGWEFVGVRTEPFPEVDAGD